MRDFQSTEELMEVSGIGSRTYETIRDLVYIGRASPLVPPGLSLRSYECPTVKM